AAAGRVKGPAIGADVDVVRGGGISEKRIDGEQRALAVGNRAAIEIQDAGDGADVGADAEDAAVGVNMSRTTGRAFADRSDAGRATAYGEQRVAAVEPHVAERYGPGGRDENPTAAPTGWQKNVAAPTVTAGFAQGSGGDRGDTGIG